MLSDDLVRGQAQHLIGALIAHAFLPKAMPNESYIVLWDVVIRQLKCVNREGARAIESAATAPLLARIAELDRSLDVMAKNTEAQAHASLQREIELTEKVEKLTRELEEARKDAELLDWMIFYSARLSHSNDAECCQVIWVNEDGEQRTKPFGNAREAIRAAIKEQT